MLEFVDLRLPPSTRDLEVQRSPPERESASHTHCRLAAFSSRPILGRYTASAIFAAARKIGLASSYCSLPNTLYFCFPKCSLCRGCSDCALALTMYSIQATCRKHLGTRGRNSAGICSIINRNRLVGALHATACIMCVEGAERPLPSRGLLHAIMKNSDRLVGIQNHACKIFPNSRGARSAPPLSGI